MLDRLTVSFVHLHSSRMRDRLPLRRHRWTVTPGQHQTLSDARSLTGGSKLIQSSSIRLSGNTLEQAVTHPAQTLTKIGAANDAPRVAAVDAFKRGDYVEGVRHGLNWVLNAIPGVGSTMEKASDQAQSGDIAGGIGKTLGVATNLAVTPKIAGGVLDVATNPDAISNAAK